MPDPWPPAGIDWYYTDAWTAIAHEDCRDVLPQVKGQATACITDPPYGLRFMGSAWDHGVPGLPFWQMIRAALVPGAPLLAFGGARTHHRLMCAIEDAGFEIRDCLMWLYGSGFPKSHDISKAIDKAAGVERVITGYRDSRSDYDGHARGSQALNTKWRECESRTDISDWARKPISAPATPLAQTWQGYGTALKPSYEPIILAMAPLDGTFAQNAAKHGVAGLNIDGCRIGTLDNLGRANRIGPFSSSRTWSVSKTPGQISSTYASGRWPANLLLDETAARLLDAQAGERTSGKMQPTHTEASRAVYGRDAAGGFTTMETYGDMGGPSRFFFTAKASRSDRGTHEQLDLPLFNQTIPALANDHPTVKPTTVLQWLCLLCQMPACNLYLDPFMGSGSLLVAAKALGIRAMGIEQDEHYCEIAAQRLAQEVPPCGGTS